MDMEAAAGEWHIVVTCVHATMRRYQGREAATAYADKAPYDAVLSVEIRGGLAHLSGALATGPGLTRADRRAIEQLLRHLGAQTAKAQRRGQEKTFDGPQGSEARA